MFPNQNPPNNNLIGLGGHPIGSSMDPVQNLNYNGIQQQHQQQQSHQQQPQQPQQHQTRQPHHSSTNRNVRRKPFVRIVEQPASKALRFRYECEGRSAGSIPGINSTPETKTYPTIEIVGYKGRAVVVVSCVTKDTPHRPHPHNLVGKEGCKKGVCTLEINADTMRAVFSNLGIQCVKKKDIEAALRAREDIRVDPYKTGFSHRSQPSSIDLNAVRLCFQVFMEGEQKGKFNQPLAPVVSEPIYDKKAMSDLVICRLCSCSATVLGNTQIILLCEKVAKEDIAIRFYEEKNGQVIWEAFGEFQHTDVHKQTAITFKTPRYHTHDITEPAKVFIQLRRPSDGVTSEALPFEYVPLDSDPVHLRRKRQKTGGDPIHYLLQQQQKQKQNELQDGRHENLNCWKPNIPAIKTEPRDASPQPYSQYRAQPELTPSPQPLSPSNNYVQNDNTSPYNIHTPVSINNGQMLSPNHHYGGGGGNNAQNLNTTASPMDMIDFDVQPHSAISLHHQNQPTQHHTQYQNNMFSTSEWEQKFNTAGTSSINPNNTNNLGNLNNANQFGMQDILPNTPNQLGPSGSNVNWNMLSNTMQNQQVPLQHQNLMQHHHQQQQQQQQHYPLSNNTNDLGTNVTTTNNTNTSNNMNGDGPTYSNLLTFDSDQLVPMNTGAQQLVLNSEDLQLSNLSIST